MNARLALCLTCTTVAVGLSLGMAACGGDNGTTSGDDASSGTSSGTSSGSRSGSGVGSGTISSGSSSARDSSVTDSAGDSTVNDTGTDSTTADTGRDTSTVDSSSGLDASDGGADTGPADTGPADTGPADTGPADTGPADTGPADTGADAGDGAVVLTGVACRLADGGGTLCAVGEHCCLNSQTQATSCQAACFADAGTYPVDCTGATGPGQCTNSAGAGAVCCGNLILTGAGTPPSCTNGGFVSRCAPPTLCNDTPPPDCTQGQYTIRTCTAPADCANDVHPSDAGGSLTHCCQFGTSPIKWCVDGLTAAGIGDGGTCMN
jgi:hypothetical protein